MLPFQIHRLLCLWSITYCAFSRLAASLHLMTTFLPPLFYGSSRQPPFRLATSSAFGHWMPVILVELWPLFTQRRRFLRPKAMSPWALNILVVSLHLVAPFLVPSVDGIFAQDFKSCSLFTRLHRFLCLQSMASCTFSQIAASLQLVALLLTPSLHDLLHLRLTCGSSLFVSSSYYASGLEASISFFYGGATSFYFSSNCTSSSAFG